jgi:hypothetical protein
MEANIENNNEEDQQFEQDRIAAAAAARRRRLKLISVLEGFDGIPFQTRNKTDELVEEFLENLEDDVHGMICSNDLGADDYRGLDSDRDTEAEVEAIIRFFPKALTRTKELEGVGNLYPIQFLSCTCNEDGIWGCNVKAVSFIPIVARLAIEFELFEEVEERGGLLCQEDINGNNMFNVLQNLMLSDQIELHNREHHEAVDDKYFQVLIQLRQMDLLMKEEIQRYGLLQILCNRSYFADMRFRFLVEWDPNALIQTDGFKGLPLHDAVRNASSIKGFQISFEAGIKYFPKKKGINILFHKNKGGHTPFQRACRKYGYNEVMKIVDDFLAVYSVDATINITEALVMAATDKNIHLDCVYFLLRREPSILQKLVSSSLPAAAVTTTAMAAVINIGDENNNDNDSVVILGQTKTNRNKPKQMH